MNTLQNPIDSRQLLAFVQLANRGSLKAAARELMVTESAISHAIRNLESNLEAKLFRRVGKGLVLTGSGSLLLNEATAILASMRDIRERIQLNEGDEGGVIRLIVGTSFMRSALHDVLSEFKYCFPDTEIDVASGDRSQCLEALQKGEVDAAVLVNLPKASENLKGRYLFSDKIHVLMSADHPLTRYTEIPLHVLCRERVYLRRKENFSTMLIQQEIARWSFELRNVVHINSFEAASELVRLGMGVTFQAPWALRLGQRTREFACRQIEDLDLHRDWYLAWPDSRTMDLRLKTLIRLCEVAGHRLSSKGSSSDQERPASGYLSRPPGKVTPL